ncbi:amino acid adenylation domain-containing protein [Streptomyces sp. NPDC050803]|uniref:non-ribosomal peptide synthetase n=1 Tax=unclassified Streptomyces TaxID=2593676 RepID=UPI00341505EB
MSTEARADEPSRPPARLRDQLTSEQRKLLEERLAARPLTPDAPAEAAPRGVRPLSFAQRGMWFLEQLLPGSTRYTLTQAYDLRGPLDVEALRTAVTAVVGRHEALCTVFRTEHGVPVAAPGAALRFTVRPCDTAGLDRALLSAATEPFDLAQGPLTRMTVFEVAADHHVLLWCVHHLVADAESLGVLHEELAVAYRAVAAGQPVRLPRPAPAPRVAEEGEVREADLAFWSDELAGAAATALPTRRTPGPREGRGADTQIRLTTDIRRLARQCRATEFMVLLAALAVVLGRYTADEEVVIGVPMSASDRPEGAVGLFVNLLPLRVGLRGKPSFGALVDRVRDICLRAFEHADVPFDRIVRSVATDRGDTPLVRIVADVQTPSVPVLEGLSVTRRPLDTGTSKFDLTFAFQRREAGLDLVLTYDTALFEASDADRLLGHVRTLLDRVAAAPDTPVHHLPLLTESECARLDALNSTGGSGRAASVPSLVAEAAARHPQDVAVAYQDTSLTYRELEETANRLAHRLRRAGVGPETRVGVLFERGPELPVVLLGILRAGGCYVPLDPAQPTARTAVVLADAGVTVVLAARELAKACAGTHVLVWEELDLDGEPATGPPSEVRPDQLAYIMYTSGSTGAPKGVLVTHRGIVRLVRGARYTDFGPGQVFLLLAPTTFDASTFELWGALCSGATLAVHPPGTPDVDVLATTLRRHGVTVLWLTAALLNTVVDLRPDALATVRHVISGGDVLSPPHVAALSRLGPRVGNGYGPTECTTFACVKREITDTGGPIPIGTPIGDTTVHVVDSDLNLVPPGTPGELLIGGGGLARGYQGRPALTAATFVPNPFGPGRLYRTGDIVRWSPNGELEFLGRRDEQVKIRGHRVETGEIEAALTAHPGVTRALVLADGEGAGNRRLVAYVSGVATGGLDALRAYCAERLPGHLIPAVFVPVPRFPMTTNGKVDRAALPRPRATAHGSRRSVPPRTPVERAVAEVWQRVLRVPEPGVFDDFFDLGGHSLLAIQLVAALGEHFGRSLPVRTVMERSTVAGIAAELAAGPRTEPVRVSAQGAPVLVTGGTGMVGRFVTAELRRRGVRTRILARPGSADTARARGQEVAVGDLADVGSLHAAMAQVAGVVHIACTFSDPGVDEAATAALVRAWDQGPFIFVSSTDVYGVPASPPAGEDHPLDASYSAYAAAKIRCESMVLAAARPKRGMTASVVRPPHVWAPDPYCAWQLRQGPAAPLFAARDGRIALPPDDRGHAWVDARDLAWVVAECVAGRASGVMNTSNGQFAWRHLAVELLGLLGLDLEPTYTESVTGHYARDFRFTTGQLLAGHPARAWQDVLAKAVARSRTHRLGQG